jgi:hypothetical protein
VIVVLVVEALILMVFGAAKVFPGWAFILANWFVFAIAIEFATKRGRFPRLQGLVAALHYLSMIGFPIVATAWKYLQETRNIDDGGIPNRLQHFGWAVCTVGVLMPLLTVWWQRRRLWERVVMTTGIIALLGNVTELFEFANKYDRIQNDYFHGQVMLKDTMADLVMNVVGAVVATVVFHYLLGSNAKKTPSE